MKLAAGSALSHYEVLGSLGAGAMGEVYRARDTRLGREVAIKVLPDHFAEDEERLRRFEREAKTLATLNHPSVAQIFGIDQVADTCFLVLELVPGESLDKRLARGPLPLDETLDVCRQIAEGLEAAHEAGVIHRDLKPANVCVTAEGKVKVLDFGLAKPAGAAHEPSSTDSVLSTEAGRVLGTPTYMAPEQARGKPIDKRVDIWAFGCVLFECLTAERAFAGETLTDVFAAVIQREPDWSSLPPSTPARVVELLRRCLAKDPRRRLRDVGEARVALAEALADPEGAASLEWGRSTKPTALPVETGRTWRARSIALACLGAGAAFAAGVLVGSRSWKAAPAPAASGIAFEVGVPDRVVQNGMIALSPDGTQLVFHVEAEGESELWVRTFSDFVARPLPGTRGARYPFWSPDGKEVGFFAGRELKRVAVAGTAPRTIAETGDAIGGSWNAAGTILFGSETGPICQVPAAGGKPVAVTEPTAGVDYRHIWPTFLPDGRRFLYLSDGSSPETHRISLGSLEGERTILLVGIHSQPCLDPRGALLVSQNDQLVAYPFDVSAGTLSGEAVFVADKVYSTVFLHGAPIAVSDNGVLAYEQGSDKGELQEVDLSGRMLRVIGSAEAYFDPAMSPDGRSLAFEVQSSASERCVWVMDIERGVRTVLSQRGRMADSPVWSADGRTLYFDENVDRDWLLVRRAADGRAPAEKLERPEGTEDMWTLDASRDGKHLLVAASVQSRFGLYLGDLEQAAPVWTPWLVSPSSTTQWRPSWGVEYGHFSPDGRWIAYTEDSSGHDEVYVAPVAGGPPAQLLQISSGGGREPRWSPDGARLFYRSANDQLMAAPLTEEGGRLRAGVSETLFDLGPSARGRNWRNTFDFMPDGQSLVLLRQLRSSGTTVHVQTGWRPF